MSLELPNSNWLECVLWLARRRKRFRITGRSMTPLLNPGDQVLVDLRAYGRASPQPGELVAALHPYQRGVRLIKRIDSITPDGRYFLVSQNPMEGTDSRAFGAVSRQRILGRVTSRLVTAA